MKDGEWTKFTCEVEKTIPVNYRKKDINKVEKLLRKTIIKAANKYIKKKKITEKTKSYLTEDIKEEIKK